MSSLKLPNVSETYFQHKVLTKLQGQPTYESLQILMTELKANASSVPSIIGGGHYGHLGLIVTADKYATLANTIPWVTPDHPGSFTPPAGGTAAQIDAAKDVWRDLKFSFDIAQATSKALIAQMVESIDSLYLRALLNRTTGQYASNVRDVLHHLFSTYGRITPQQVKAKEVSIYTMTYTIATPVDTVFNAIDDLIDLADHGNAPMTTPQMVDLAYVVLSKEHSFQQDIRAWNRLPSVDKTWPAMLHHFREAQADLSNLPTAGDLYHHPNQANAAVLADLVAQRLLAAIPSDADTPIPLAEFHTPPEAANAVLQTRESALATREAALLTQMSDMMALMRNGGNNNGNTNNRSTRRPSRHNDRSTDRNNDRPTGGRGRAPLPRQYCWSHGYCAHASNLCNRQLPGHQVSATATNMQGGNTTNCFWVTSA